MLPLSQWQAHRLVLRLVLLLALELDFVLILLLALWYESDACGYYTS
jgi:hypothetical protein